MWERETLCTSRVFGSSLKSGHLTCDCRIFSHLHLLIVSSHDSISPPSNLLDAWSSSLKTVFSNIRTSGTLFSTFQWHWCNNCYISACWRIIPTLLPMAEPWAKQLPVVYIKPTYRSLFDVLVSIHLVFVRRLCWESFWNVMPLDIGVQNK